MQSINVESLVIGRILRLDTFSPESKKVKIVLQIVTFASYSRVGKRNENLSSNRNYLQ
jgi:hypothetical protein